MARVAEAEDGGGPVPTAGRSYVVATGHGTTETLSAVRFKVMCYNILAQTYVRSPVFPYSVPSALKWRHRRQNLLEEMLAGEEVGDGIVALTLRPFELVTLRLGLADLDSAG